MMEGKQTNNFQWKLHVDGSSNTHGSGAGIVITTPEGDAVECAMRFDFKATNNQAEYEALLVGLRVCITLGADKLEIFNDSQVVLNHDNLSGHCKKIAQKIQKIQNLLDPSGRK
ncbi:hypothetical protein LWI29_024587 [Acer saccharum]|uniref:RNase H type-1 domain-containing protein n=1 Tax=Acer saccharum TaxID=4024 RepID=A0AA39RYV5_ACESA|nr:hypothetical protein LWI29_024587 [Acer saccharum]